MTPTVASANEARDRWTDSCQATPETTSNTYVAGIAHHESSVRCNHSIAPQHFVEHVHSFVHLCRLVFLLFLLAICLGNALDRSL